jgi:xanthine dehydrogenase accessory factor
MLRLQQQALQTVLQWLKQGEPCWLATICHTYGSSPRPIGSLMACNIDGTVVGSLSGGCIEEELIKNIIHSPKYQKKPCWIRYPQSNEEDIPHQLPCGGKLKILLEPLFSHQLSHFETLLVSLKNRETTQRCVDIPSGKMQIKHTNSSGLDASETQLRHSLLPQHRLLIIGINPVSLYVAEIANSLDFQVTLCDPRKDFHKHWCPENFPYITFTEKLPDDVVRAGFNDNFSAIVALAHDPRIDDMALMEALLSNAFYVGAMGSQNTTNKRKERLKELGISQPHISALHAPIGLPIGSKTPMEIAISIAAELTLARNSQRNTEHTSSHE